MVMKKFKEIEAIEYDKEIPSELLKVNFKLCAINSIATPLNYKITHFVTFYGGKWFAVKIKPFTIGEAILSFCKK